MNPRHYVPGPDEIDGVSPGSDENRGNLASLYPEIKKDDRPLIMSDEERHRQHDEDLRRQVRGIRKSFVPIGILTVLPLILLGLATTAYFQLSSLSPQLQTMAVIPLLLVSLVIVGVWVASYHWILARFTVHGLKGGSFIFTALIFLSLTVLPLFYVTWVTNNLWVHSLLFYPAFAVTSVVISGCMLYVATFR